MSRRGRAVATLALTGSVLSGCATLDEYAVAETHRLGDAPYYVALAQPQPAPGSCAIVLPVTLDPRLGESLEYRNRLVELEPIVAELNAELDRREGCVRPVRGGPASVGAPRVYVGSSDSDYAPPEAASQRLPEDRFQPMVMHLERPSPSWRSDVGSLVSQSASSYAIAIQLGVSQYMKGYSGVFRKEVVLGTGYRQPIKFLTAEDKPVEVLHLTGVIVDGSGRPVRAGAEGIVLRDTPFLAQTVDASRSLDSDELRRVLQTERRGDLPGQPLKLNVALDNLLRQLTRGEVRVPAR